MTDRRLQDIDENMLQDIIRGLPGREPGLDLRAGVLSQTSAHARRRWLAVRPALAAAFVAALLAIDIIVLKLQDGNITRRPAGELVAASPQTATDSDEAWLAQMLDGAAPARIASLRADTSSGADTYAALRASLLANGSGG